MGVLDEQRLGYRDGHQWQPGRARETVGRRSVRRGQPELERDAPPGVGTVDYHVERRTSGGTDWSDACGTTASSRITATSCSDTPGSGVFAWRVTAHFHSWTATSDESDELNVNAVDSTPPTGSVTAPAASANVRATVTITSDSADTESGVASALFQRSPHGADTWTDVASADTTAPYSVTWDTTAVADGLYDLRVVTTDVAGNTFTSDLVANVRVDNTAPSVSLSTAPTSTGAFSNGTTVYFRGNAAGTFALVATITDAGSGPGSATFPVLTAAGWTTHTAETVSTPAGGPFTSSAFTFASGASVPATYTVTVADASGNCSQRRRAMRPNELTWCASNLLLDDD